MRLRHWIVGVPGLYVLAGCAETGLVAPSAGAPPRISLLGDSISPPQTTFSFQVEGESDEVAAKKRSNIQKLRNRALGCQEWEPIGGGNARVTFVEAAGTPLQAHGGLGSDERQFVAAWVDYAGDGNRTRILCLLPNGVIPEVYLTDLRNNRKVRGRNSTTILTAESRRLSRANRSAVSYIVAGWAKRYEGQSSSTSAVAADVHTLSPVVTIAYRDPFFWMPFGESSGGDEPEPGDVTDPEEEMLEEDDGGYCPQNDCWDDDDGYEGCPMPVLSAEQTSLVTSFAENPNGYCAASMAAVGRACVDVYIHSCYTLVGLLVGDCRESSTQDNRHRFRARFVVDVNSGTMVGTPAISETCDRLGLCFGGIGGAPNGWLFAASNNGGTTVHGHLLNYHPLFGNPVVAPAIDFQLDFKMDGKALDGSFGGDGYPTFAVFKGENGYWGAGKIFSEGHFLQLASPLGTWTVKCLFRIP